jgi:site-specific DNA-methyltransferase (adenine-specific)
MKKLRIKVAHGDCLDVLKTLPEGSVDCIVTDPPYGLTPVNPRGKQGKGKAGFMGKAWDADVPSTKIWRECLRVLKPGAFAFVMCSPRQDCLAKLILRLKKAGFVIGVSSIYWVYSQGFGKAQNISKVVDKRAGAKREVIGTDLGAQKRALKNNFDQFNSMNKSNKGTNTRAFAAKAGLITAPATDEAKALDGAYAGFQPKPAVEPVVVAFKPITENTYVDQALANGKGCTWLDDCRIPLAGDTSREAKIPHTQGGFIGGYGGAKKVSLYEGNKGRVPANVIVEDGALNTGTRTTSGVSTKKHGAYKGKSNTNMLRGKSSPAN